MNFSESTVEDAALGWFGDLDYAVLHGPEVAPGEAAAERSSFSEAFLPERLRAALRKLNPKLPAEALEDAFRKITLPQHPSLIANNRAFHRMLVDGIAVECRRKDGSIGAEIVRLIDFADAENNDWLVVNQFTLIEGQHNRRPDVVIFINGLLLGVIELKNAADENADIWQAFQQFQTYKQQIPALFVHNAVLVISDGLEARIGTISANKERFMPWRTVDGEAVAPATMSQLEVLLRGVFDKRRFLDLIRHFVVFEDDGGNGVIKKLAGYHQFHAVNIAVAETIRAVEDKATVPIFYESRLAKLELKSSEKPKINPDFEDATEGEELEHKERLKSKWAALEAVVGADKRIGLIADDLVKHWEARLEVMDGKAMIVCMSRRICFDLYEAIRNLRPKWHHKDDEKGVMKIVMTGSASDPLEWQDHIRNKPRREALAKRFKDGKDPFKIVIVRDMWLTGFDAPCLHTMYLDKPMRSHGLMQAIARVNRVFKDKPGGLVVDYLGLAHELKQALATYTESGGHGRTAIDQEEAVAVMLEKYEICCDHFHGFDWSKWTAGKPTEKLGLLPAAQEFIYAHAAKTKKPDEHKQKFLRAVTELSQAFALSVPHTKAIEIRDDVGFFQAVRAAIAKNEISGKEKSPEDIDAAIRQIISRAVASDEVVDIFAAAGLKKPDISILSDDFLAEVRGMPQKNLAVELLRKLLNNEIKLRAKKFLIQSKSFAELLEKSIRKYQNRAIETVQLIEELIQLAKEMRQSANRGEQLGLTEDEVAFYDALEVNDSAVKALGDEQLRFIARELLKTIRENITIDWTAKESVRAKLRVMVKRILRKYGYPPDKQEKATQTVLEQAELICAEVAA